MPFDPPELETDEDAVTDRILDGLADRLPGWEPVEGAPEVALAEELGREIATVNQTALDGLAYMLAGIGETAFGIPTYEGVPAQIEVDITVTEVGAVIPAGFAVAGFTINDDEVAFELEDTVVAATETVTLTMTAVTVGDIGNGVPDGPLTIITATTSVVDVVATNPSSNGADPEPIDVYLDRLVDYLATLRPGGVRADDLASLARTVPGVHRALAIDLYDPADPENPAERTATVFPIDDAGDPVAAPVAAQLQQVLEDAREVNFIVHVDEPTYTSVAIAYEAVAETGADPVEVEAEVDAAIGGWLSTWGASAADPQAWQAKNTVRLLELSQVAGSAPGVAYLASLTINGVAADVALPGVAALPKPVTAEVDPSTITGNVVVP